MTSVNGPEIAFAALPLDAGEHEGTRRSGAQIMADGPTRATWTSPVTEPGFAFTELVPTWHASTPGGSWLEIAARVRSVSGDWSGWLELARWADSDHCIRSTSVPGQADETTPEIANDIATADVDTVRAKDRADAWQLRFGFHAPDGQPAVTYAAGVVSAPDERSDGARPTTEPTYSAPPHVLAVPALSQRVHTGHYPQWGGGGQSWCSPTSVSMLLGFWGRGPDPAELDWVDPGYPDPAVYHAVRHCWDEAYDGAGNWSFNVAYAARFGLESFVTRLRSLNEAAAFIAAGIPLIASVLVDPAALTGADYTSAGHLVVVTGFTSTGDVAVNDPGARNPSTVSREYRRDEFDRAWRVGSGRTVYVIHPSDVRRPVRTDQANW